MADYAEQEYSAEESWDEQLRDNILEQTGPVFQQIVDIMTTADAEKLKKALIEYFAESMHQSFDGHDPLNLPMYARLVEDINLSLPILMEEQI